MPLAESVAPLQATATVRSDDAPPTRWLGLDATGRTGWNVSILIGPTCTVAPQFPSPSLARTWNQCSPSASGIVSVVVPVSASFTSSGTKSWAGENAYE